MYCLRQQKVTGLMKYKNETFVAIYSSLNGNAISVIEDNTFKNLPILNICQYYLILFIEKYVPYMTIHVVGNALFSI
jgi:hypothetical protein